MIHIHPSIPSIPFIHPSIHPSHPSIYFFIHPFTAMVAAVVTLPCSSILRSSLISLSTLCTISLSIVESTAVISRVNVSTTLTTGLVACYHMYHQHHIINIISYVSHHIISYVSHRIICVTSYHMYHIVSASHHTSTSYVICITS